MKNSNDTIGNRTRDLPVCSAVPQPTAPPRAPGNKMYGLDIPLGALQRSAVKVWNRNPGNHGPQFLQRSRCLACFKEHLNGYDRLNEHVTRAARTVSTSACVSVNIPKRPAFYSTLSLLITRDFITFDGSENLGIKEYF